MIFMADSFNCESTGDLTDTTASIYDRKTAARPFDTINDIFRSLSLVQTLLKDRKTPIRRQQERTHMRQPETDVLIIKSKITKYF